MTPQVQVKVSGPLACFTRPELKTERVSYPVMTPSAARGMIEAILWKPSIRWVITGIRVLRPIQFTSFRRNEVNGKASLLLAKRAMRGEPMAPYLADEDRAQRTTLALRDVAYLVDATFDFTPRRTPDEHPLKFVEMFNRRVEKGQCFQRPYFGCREFVADFMPPAGDEQPIDDTRDLGLMLHDLDYGATIAPRFFEARLERGVLAVPRFVPQARGAEVRP